MQAGQRGEVHLGAGRPAGGSEGSWDWAGQESPSAV